MKFVSGRKALFGLAVFSSAALSALYFFSGLGRSEGTDENLATTNRPSLDRHQERQRTSAKRRYDQLSQVAAEESAPPGEKADLKNSILDQYNSFIAVSHTPRGQIGLYQTLKDCSSFRDRSIEEFDQEITKLSGLDSIAVEKRRAKFIGCQPLLKELGQIDVASRAEAWIESAAETGSPVAKLMAAYEYPALPPKEELIPSVYGALEAAERDPTLRKDVYFLTLRAYRDYVEEDSNLGNPSDPYSYKRGVDSDAWEYLYCNSSPNCEVSEYLSMYDEYYEQYEKQAMIERSRELT